jgi:hypothetical protein
VSGAKLNVDGEHAERAAKKRWKGAEAAWVGAVGDHRVGQGVQRAIRALSAKNKLKNYQEKAWKGAAQKTLDWQNPKCNNYA